MRAGVQRDLRAVRRGNLTHDGKTEPAAGTRGPRDAVETLEHLPALHLRNARPVVFANN